MKANKSLFRQSHFLGTKIRNLRKRNNLTMEDLSTRCIHIDPEYAPSVSYLSMIERGKRVPSTDMLEVIGQVFQKDLAWFLDDTPEESAITPTRNKRGGGLSGMALEPSFLFTQDILQIAIPELLSQSGTSSKQFAHLLIRAHQEHHQNHFPDLEKAAESIGKKNMHWTPEALITILKQFGVKVCWFSDNSQYVTDETGAKTKQLKSSYFEPPNTLFLNEKLQKVESRLKYELATYIGHCVLHQANETNTNNDNKIIMSIGGGQSHRIANENQPSNTPVNPHDIVHAWRDFESSFFAGALLCPRVPFRQLLERGGYEIDVHRQLGLSASVIMRRMTAVSNYKYWHYFDAYSPGKLKAVYRGNGIPLPWGNMTAIKNPCHHWAVFRAMQTPITGSSAQLSLMDVAGKPRIYVCESVSVSDMAGNPHVLCAGIDLNPAIEAQGKDTEAIASELSSVCKQNDGECEVPKNIKQELMSVSRILNINWIERGINNRARLICSQGGNCPRQPNCCK
ncbi:DUF3612 domain-containing protein [Thalassotalea marina]|uniref:Transcriptional regulator n=1 Tax=Thalassotalea marina TaxID=1673741 RepID=A0A919ELZ3_9GAMM|nr:DUF3612 domain-containing protein [Thalassotalea marina]GHF96447.1 transcriptional regulator [Thalassotalea marina]